MDVMSVALMRRLGFGRRWRMRAVEMRGREGVGRQGPIQPVWEREEEGHSGARILPMIEVVGQ